MQFDEHPDGELQEKDVAVVTATGGNERSTYHDDFGDSWEHEITVHRVSRCRRRMTVQIGGDVPNRQASWFPTISWIYP